MTTPAEQIRAEAASWVTRLHGPDRSVEIELGLKRWLAESAAHVRAFELATEVWQETADLPGGLPKPEMGRPRTAPLRVALAYATAVVLAILGLVYYAVQVRGTTLATGIGEQRTVTLADGTRVELNTDSELRVKYDEHARRVILTAGEAYFDVARQPRPFIVVAGSREVVALGTAFLVRRDQDNLTVTLLEGRVAVTPVSAPTTREKRPLVAVNVLNAGQRLKLDRAGVATVDSPALGKVTAWQRGQLVFEDTPLSEAVAEFNRYSANRIRLGSADLGRLRVGGTFRVGDLTSFAHAVAESQDLEVIDRGREVLLARVGGDGN